MRPSTPATSSCRCAGGADRCRGFTARRSPATTTSSFVPAQRVQSVGVVTSARPFVAAPSGGIDSSGGARWSPSPAGHTADATQVGRPAASRLRAVLADLAADHVSSLPGAVRSSSTAMPPRPRPVIPPDQRRQYSRSLPRPGPDLGPDRLGIPALKLSPSPVPAGWCLNL